MRMFAGFGKRSAERGAELRGAETDDANETQRRRRIEKGPEDAKLRRVARQKIRAAPRQRRATPRGRVLSCPPCGHVRCAKDSLWPSDPQLTPRTNNRMMPEDESLHVHFERLLAERRVEDLSAEEVRPLINKGIPLKYRHRLWSSVIRRAGVELENASARPRGESSDSEISLGPEEVDEDLRRTIEKDISRTRVGWLNAGMHDSLRRVLLRYAAHNPAIGYCQGMNCIACIFLLLGFDEGDAFLGLRYMVEVVCTDYHSPSLEGYVDGDALVLESLVRKVMPELCGQLTGQDMSLRLMALSHFLTIGSENWPLAAVVRLWDLVLLEGSRAIFASFLALLQRCVPDVLDDLQANSHAPEPMSAFKAACLGQVTENLEDVLQDTCCFLEALDAAMLESARGDVRGA